jgi:hypothetical protein
MLIRSTILWHLPGGNAENYKKNFWIVTLLCSEMVTSYIQFSHITAEQTHLPVYTKVTMCNYFSLGSEKGPKKGHSEAIIREKLSNIS